MSATSPGRAAAVPEVLADTRRRRADWARQVADILRRQVLQGAFPDGLLPDEASLAQAFGASRNAVRDAFGILRAEGLLVRVQGVGTMVAARKYPHGLDRLLGLAETLREHGEVVNEVRTAGMIVPPPAVAARLRPPGGPPVTAAVCIERLRRLNGLPFSLDFTYRGAPDDLPSAPLPATEQEFIMPLVQTRADVPVTIDASLCVEGCTLCVDICPLDSLAISPDSGKAYMHVDECWYCGPCAARCDFANPFGGYQVNHRGERFVDCDYWSGQMMAEVAREIASARGPIYLKLTHLPEETISALEGILHTTERPTRGTFHACRGHDYRTHDVEMHISEIGLCGGHSSSGVWVDENAATTVPGLYAAGDLACVPHNYMIGAFVFGDLAGAHATEFARGPGAAGPGRTWPGPGEPASGPDPGGP